MSLIKCCKDCKDRHPACHDSCDKYQKEKTESNKARDKRLQFYQTEHDIVQLKKRKKK